MSLTKRLLTFGIGFFIGVMLLIFFWNKKNVSFNYGPDARVISQILKKEKQTIAPEIQDFLNVNHIDSTKFRKMIKQADIDFSKSHQHKKPCREFLMETEYEQQLLEIQVKLCDSLVNYYHIDKKY